MSSSNNTHTEVCFLPSEHMFHVEPSCPSEESCLCPHRLDLQIQFYFDTPCIFVMFKILSKMYLELANLDSKIFCLAPTRTNIIVAIEYCCCCSLQVVHGISLLHYAQTRKICLQDEDVLLK